MWLKINKTFFINGGDIRLDYIYVKAYAEIQFDNHNISTYTRCYSSMESFERDINSNLKIDGFDKPFNFTCSRSTNALDFLKYIYSNIVKEITSSIKTSIPKVDEYGNILYDDIGNIIYEEITIKPAICDISECEIIDS